MKQVLLLQLEVRKLCRQFLEMFPLSLFLLPESVSLLYLLLADCSVLLLPADLVSLDFLHPVFLAVLASDLDSPAVLASDLDSPAVPASDLGSLASAPALAVLRCIPSDLLLDVLLFLSKMVLLLLFRSDLL